jgi:uncharacterized protein YkwD
MQRIAYWASVDSVFRGESPSNHVDTLGRLPWYDAHNPHPSRAVECSGYAVHDYVSEINYWGVGGNAPTAEAALAWWKQSPGHNALLLDSKATTFGVGRAYMGLNAERQHWTVDFSTH